MCQMIFFLIFFSSSLERANRLQVLRTINIKAFSSSMNHDCSRSIHDRVAKQTYMNVFHKLILVAKARNFPVHYTSGECLLCILGGSLYLRCPCHGFSPWLSLTTSPFTDDRAKQRLDASEWLPPITRRTLILLVALFFLPVQDQPSPLFVCRFIINDFPIVFFVCFSPIESG